MFSSAIRVALVISALSILAISLRAQQPLINEVVSLNGTGLQDFEGDYTDWIELYNPGSETLNLQGYSITDDFLDTDPWIIPDIELPPNEYVVIFASGKDLIYLEELHTHFKVSSEGEEIYLFTPDGNVADQVTVPELLQDKAFGRFPNGASTWSRLDIATPGTSNSISNHLHFSYASGFYASDFMLEVTSLSDDPVYYTTDGSVPTPASSLYVGEIEIQDRSDYPNVFAEIPTTIEGLAYKGWESPDHKLAKAYVLRFASYRDTIRSSDIYTREFFVGSTFNRYSLPVVSLVTEAANLFDPDTGIYVPGQHYNPADSAWTGNYFQAGKEWERNVHISYFPTGGSAAFSQDAGVRVHGGKGRSFAQKSLRLYARKEYGEQYFNYPLLPNRNLYQYKRFVLRTTMGGWVKESMLGDDLAQRLSSGLNVEYQDSQPVIVFINGEYWGIHSLKDRIDERYFGYVGAVDKDSVVFRKDPVVEYAELLNFIEGLDLSVAENYDTISQMIDIDNYIDYQIAEQFFANYDWPSNNLTAWKETSVGGKWRWVVHDFDAGFATPLIDMLHHATRNDSLVEYPNPPWSTVLFRSLLENEAFTEKFVSRFAEVLNGDFQSDLTRGILSEMRVVWAPEVLEHADRWHYPESYDRWTSDVNLLDAFLEARPCYAEEQIIDFFELSEFDFSCTVGLETKPENSSQGDIVLAPNPNNGEFSLFNTTTDDWNSLSVSIYNVNGSVVFSREGLKLEGNSSVSFNLNSISNGLYIAEIKSNARVERLKFIVGE